MTDLSPYAQAVRDAALATYDKSISKDDNLWALDRASVVAALRAAANTLLNHKYWHDGFWDNEPPKFYRRKLLAIAAELEKGLHD